MGATILFSSSLKFWGNTMTERVKEAKTSLSVCHFNKNGHRNPFLSLSSTLRHSGSFAVLASSFSPSSSPKSSTRLYVSGLSFRTTVDSLTDVFQNFGQLVEVNLVMDKVANRPRGFAFLQYATEQESQKAIEGMHGKIEMLQFSSVADACKCKKRLKLLSPLGEEIFRVIFVEVAKPRSNIHKSLRKNS